jgi:hypothetical protein
MTSVTARTARPPARRTEARLTRVLPVALTVAVGDATFWLAYDNGAYGLVSRTSGGLVIWWTIAVGLVAGLWPRARLGRPALVAGLLLALFAVWTAASIEWDAQRREDLRGVRSCLSFPRRVRARRRRRAARERGSLR